MAFLLGRGVISILFAIFFFCLLFASVRCLRSWGRHSGFFRLCIFCASKWSRFLEIINWCIVRVSAAICGIIVAADNFGKVDVIIAEIILNQVGSFMIYYTLVAFYHASYNYPEFTTDNKCKVLQFLARRCSKISLLSTTSYVVRSCRSCHWKWCRRRQLQQSLLCWLGSETCQSIFYHLFILVPEAG